MLQKDIKWPVGWPVGGFPGPQVMTFSANLFTLTYPFVIEFQPKNNNEKSKKNRDRTIVVLEQTKPLEET